MSFTLFIVIAVDLKYLCMSSVCIVVVVVITTHAIFF